jgi:hypothetical protein
MLCSVSENMVATGEFYVCPQTFLIVEFCALLQIQDVSRLVCLEGLHLEELVLHGNLLLANYEDEALYIG